MRGRFAYVPRPAAGELLGSWVHRMAIAHGVNGTDFLQVDPGDLDWATSGDVARFLARGTGRSTASILAMTISYQVPSARRPDFAMALGPVPGCQAYCPECGAYDRAEHGEAVQRIGNAGRWRMACGEHGLLLDGVRDEKELTPSSRRPDRSWLEGRLPVHLRSNAPLFVFAFERALRAAEAGRVPSGLWSVREASGFVEIAQLVASTALLRQPYGRRLESAAGALFEGPKASQIGIDLFDPKAIDRVCARSRVRALMAAALLMLSPHGADRLGVDTWPRLRVISDWRRRAETAWEAAMAPWHWSTIEVLLSHAGKWPHRLHAHIEAMVLPRMKFLDG